MTHYPTATIIGGSGFIGRYIVKHLARAQWRVKVVCRHPQDALHLRVAGTVGQVVPVYGDVRKAETLDKAIAGSDAVVYLPGLLAQIGGQKFQDIHVEGLTNTARLCAAHKVDRFIVVSALGADRQSRARYAQTKAMGEDAALQEFPNVTILRPSLVFGAEDRFFNFFARLAQFSPLLPAFLKGKTKFQPVYVDDVARSVCNALSLPETRGKIYELGGPSVYSFRDLLRLTVKISGQKAWILPLPGSISWLKAACLSLVPGKPMTLDQLRLLRQDNVCTGKEPGLTELGVQPTALEQILPEYLQLYRPGGVFAHKRQTS